MNSKNTGPSSGSEKIGLTLTAYLNVRLEKHSDSHKRNPMDVFRASVQKWPEVVECHALTGDMDYLLRVVVRNMAHYSRFVLDTLIFRPAHWLGSQGPFSTLFGHETGDCFRLPYALSALHRNWYGCCR